MKQIIFERYKLINISLAILLGSLLFFMDLSYESWFQKADTKYFYDNYYALYDPIFSGGKWLAGILGVLLLFPSHIFKRWLFFVLPLPLLITYWLVKDISVYGGGVLYISRAQMAENGMIGLSVVTALFVLGHLLYDLKSKKK